MKQYTHDEERRLVAMSKHFPSIKAGHGSVRSRLLTEDSPAYRPIVCNVPDCSPDNPKHRQSPLKAAERFMEDCK